MGTKSFYENYPNPLFFFGTKNMSEGHFMHTVLVCYVFDKLERACLCGGHLNSNCKLEVAEVYFQNTRVRPARRADKAALLPVTHNGPTEDTNKAAH